MELFFWVVMGTAVAWIMQQITVGVGNDRTMDFVLGITGGVAGGFLLHSMPLLPVRGAMIYTNLSAILGACILTSLFHYSVRRRAYQRAR